MATIATERVGTGRRRAFAILTVVFGLAAGIGTFSFLSLIFGWFETGDRQVHRVHDIGGGLQVGILIAVAYLLQVRRPERKVALMQQAGLAIVAYLIAALISTEGGGLLFGLLFVVVWAVLAWLHPARRSLFRAGEGFSPVLAIITAAAAVPLVVYALNSAELQRTGLRADEHVEELHWVTMAALAFGLILVGALTSLRPPGWRLSAWSAGVAAALFGLASVLNPNYAGAVGEAWGAVAIAGAVLFVAVAEWEARRSRTPSTGASGP